MKKRGYQNKHVILVTGSEGFIGKNLVPYLLEQGHMVFGWDIKSENSIFDINLESVLSSGCHIKDDVAYDEIDTVIHLAAETSVQRSFSHPGNTYYTNVGGTAHIAYLCDKYKKKLIYPSSAAVYDPKSSPYAGSKFMAEDIVATMMDKNRFTILRLFNVFGPNMTPENGAVMYNFLHKKKIVVNGNGRQTRDFIHIRDVVRIFEAALRPSWNKKIVEVGSGEKTTIRQVANYFSKERNIPITFGSPKKEIRHSVSNTTMLNSLYKKPLSTNIQLDVYELCKKLQ